MSAILHFVFLTGFSVGCKLLIYPDSYTLLASLLTVELTCLAFCPSGLACSSKHHIVHKLGMNFGLGAVTWTAGPTHGAGLAVRATVDPLLVYTTTFGTYVKYKSQSRQVAKHLVGYRLSERHSHQAAYALSCHTHIQTHQSLPLEFNMHMRPIDFVL